MNTVHRTPEQKQAGLTTAKILLEIKAVNFRPEEPYTLTAGWASPVYIDCRKVISFPQARRKITEMAVANSHREEGFAAIDAVAGGETAGIPYAAWIAESMALPMLYVRKKPKGFGRMAQIEGDMKEGSRVLLVEDLATDGGSKITFVNALRDAGAQVRDCFVVFFYGVFPGALKVMDDAGVRLHYLANWWDVLEVAEEGKYFPAETIEGVRAFLNDPIGWSVAHGGRGADG
ncbi:MAG: orotate phosphoribosyltransferase [Rhodospirillales bacterium]|nr:orotate phosphoribosyltransferase [Rhodospirillales bacterium]